MYQEENRKQKFITMGEIMLRLTPPDCEKIRTADCFEARYGGSEANVALSLANLGIDSSYFTVVPDNSLGKSAIRMMKSNDVDCTPVIFSTSEETPTHRLGTYIWRLDMGFVQVRSFMTENTVLLMSMILLRSIWKNYWMAIPGCI